VDGLNGCVACPSNAVCSDGVMSCVENYLAYGGRCIFDERVLESQPRVRRFLEDKLAVQKGLFECNEADTVFLSLPELREEVSSVGIK
jgi:hypothetical protein